MDMRATKYGQLSCGWPLAVDLNAVIDDAAKGMRITSIRSNLYGRYSCGGHAYGEVDTVDSYMRWLIADRHIRWIDDTVMGYPVSFAVPRYGAVDNAMRVRYTDTVR